VQFSTPFLLQESDNLGQLLKVLIPNKLPSKYLIDLLYKFLYYYYYYLFNRGGEDDEKQKMVKAQF